VNFVFKDKWEFISNLEANRTGAFDVDYKDVVFHQARAVTEAFHKWSRLHVISVEKENVRRNYAMQCGEVKV